MQHVFAYAIPLAHRAVCNAAYPAGPYLPESGDEDPETASLSLPVLLALLLIAHVDASWRMPRWVCESALRTALFLQAHDGAEVHWPWRGWRFLTASPADTAKLEGGDVIPLL